MLSVPVFDKFEKESLTGVLYTVAKFYIIGTVPHRKLW